MKKGLAELVFILDRSGSMYGLESDTIGGFNGMLEKQKKEEGQANVTTILFDDQVETIHDRFPIEVVKPLNEEDYYARGATALLDAIGSTIKKIENIQQRLPEELQAEKVIFIITTDGQENASVEYTGKMVKKMIEAQQEKGWQFIFMGANMDAVTEAAKLGIDKKHAVRYQNDVGGVLLNYEVTSDVLSKMRGRSLSKEKTNEMLEKAFEPIRKHLKK